MFVAMASNPLSLPLYCWRAEKRKDSATHQSESLTSSMDDHLIHPPRSTSLTQYCCYNCWEAGTLYATRPIWIHSREHLGDLILDIYAQPLWFYYLQLNRRSALATALTSLTLQAWLSPLPRGCDLSIIQRSSSSKFRCIQSWPTSCPLRAACWPGTQFQQGSNQVTQT